MLQSAPALHPNQRCGGCAARPSIFHTKGRPPPPLRSPPRQPTRTAGQCRGAEKTETDTQTRTERPCKFKPGLTLWDQKGRVGQGPLEMKRDRHTEGTEAGTGPEEMGETGESQSQRVESKTGDRHDHRDTQRAELARTDRDSRDRKWTQAQGKTESQGPRAKYRSICAWREGDHKQRERE